MNSDFTLSMCKGYVHVQLAENYEITPEGMAEQWRALTAFCKSQNCKRILWEGKIAPTWNMSIHDAYLAGTKSAKTALGYKLACCWEGQEIDETTAFLEMVSLNRGMTIRFFKERSEALAWLGVEEE